MSKNKLKIRKSIQKLKAGRLRLSIFKSNLNLLVQIIDDKNKHTMLSENSLKIKNKTRKEKALLVAKGLSEKAKKLKVTKVYYDGARRYKGSIKLLIEELRTQGLDV